MLFFPRPECGQGLLEYALLIALVALLVVVMLTLYGASVGNMFSNIVQTV